MRWLRYPLFVLLAAPICLITGAIGQQPGAAPTAKPPAAKAPPPPKADAEAAKVLDAAIQALDPKRLEWLETTLWQQVDLQGLTFQAEGSYLSGPNHRLCLDLQVRLGDTLGKLLVVSDGATLWERLQIGASDKIEVKKTDLRSLLNRDLFPERIQSEFIPLAGVVPLLQNIRRQMTVTGQEKIQWRGRSVVKLTAAWSGDVAKAIVAGNSSWPNALPRKCCLYLDDGPTQTHWPHRVEWWGPVSSQAGDGLLLQMEFRNPKLAQEVALSDEQRKQYAARFRFSPGNLPVQDQTKQVLEQAKNRGKQLANQQGKP